MNYPPAAMSKRTASEYCGLTVAAFERAVAAGRLPAPFGIDRYELWSRQQLDKALAVLAGEVIDGDDIVVGDRDAA